MSISPLRCEQNRSTEVENVCGKFTKGYVNKETALQYKNENLLRVTLFTDVW